MALRQFVRGQIEWDRLEAVAAEIATRYDEQTVRVEYIDADNWLSTPCVVNEEWFVKIISPQNSFVHALFTTARNLGVFSSGSEGFFEQYGEPLEMAEHEFEATEKMRSCGVNAPEPIEAFGHDGLGVLVLEYLRSFRTLDELGPAEATAHTSSLFDSLATCHDNGLAHGDLRGENVLISDGELFFIDATTVRDASESIENARGYDLACALAVLEPLVGASAAVDSATENYSTDAILDAREFLDFVNMRPDHDFEAPLVKGEIEKAADGV